MVVTAVQTITAYRTASRGAAASIMMMTSVRMVRPIVDTPSRIPEATATTAVTETTVGKDGTAVTPKEEEGDAFEQPRLGDDRDEQRQTEDEQHRVGIDQLVEAFEGKEMMAGPSVPPAHGDLSMPCRCRQLGERRPG